MVARLFRFPSLVFGIGFIGLLSTPHPGVAQTCYRGDTCPDAYPTVSIVPSGGSYSSAYLSLSFWLADDHGLNTGTFSYTLTGATGPTIIPAFTSSRQGYWSGTITLQPGSNNSLTVRICDNINQCTSASASYTYNPPPPPPPHSAPSVSVTPNGGDYRDMSHCVANCFEQALAYAPPAYTSLDVARSVTLLYTTAQTIPAVTVQVDATDASGTTPDRMSFKLQRGDGSFQPFDYLPGSPSEVFFVGGNGVSRLGGRFTTGSTLTGAYSYTAAVTSYWNDGTVLSSTAPLRVLVARETQSPYGYGWSIAGLQRLAFQSDGIVVTNGTGSVAFFANCVTACNTYVNPKGDFTTLTRRADGTGYDRRLPDGTVASFDPQGRMTSVADRFANRTSYSYNGTSLQVAAITDPIGLVTTLSYDVSGRIASIQTPGGRISQFAVNASGDLTTITDPDGVIAMQIGYDATHVPQYVIDRRGGRSDFGYDRAGKLSSVQSPTFTANAGSARLVRGLRSLEQQVLIDPASGTGTSTSPASRRVSDALRAKVTSPNGDSTVYAVDPFGAPTRQEFRDPLGQWRVNIWGYNDQGQVVSAVSSEGGRSDYTWAGPNMVTALVYNTGSRTEFKYEPTYNQVDTILVNGALQQANFYGTLGRLDSTKVGASVTTYTYDAKGRVLTVTDPTQNQTSIAYFTTAAQNTQSIIAPTGAGRGTITFQYDAFGRVQQVTNPAGQATSNSYDLLNRDTSTVGPAADTTRFGFNDASRIYSVTDAKHQTYVTYGNPIGLADSLKDPRGGIERSSYDAYGNLISYTNRRGGGVTYSYDQMYRPLTLTADGKTTTFAYDSSGLWLAAANDESTDTLRFDAIGRPTESDIVRAGVRNVLQSNYSPEGVRTSVSAQGPWGTRSLGYNYDNLFRLSGVTDQGGNLTSVAYNPDQLPSTVTLPITVSGTTKLTETSSYSPGHRPWGLSYNDGAVDPAVGRRYSYDNLDRTVTTTWGTPPWQGTMQDEVQRTLRYDVLGRLTHYDDVHNWQSQGQLICPDPYDLTTCYYDTINHSDPLRQQDFGYDLVGNRTDLGAVIETGNRLTAFNGYTLTYDSDGNLIRKYEAGVLDQSFTWNTLGQLTSVITNGVASTFGYDAVGRRVRKTANGVTTRYLWDGDNLVMELDGSGNPLREYSYYPGIDQPLSMRRSSDGALFYYATEEPGHVAGLVSTADQVVNSYQYTPFGEVISASEQAPQPLRYAAREYDSESGLYYNRARYYDPQLGRFISEDPVGLDGGINPYAYVRNDPVNGRDPSGEIECVWGVWRGRLIDRATGTILDEWYYLVFEYCIPDYKDGVSLRPPGPDPNEPREGSPCLRGMCHYDPHPVDVGEIAVAKCQLAVLWGAADVYGEASGIAEGMRDIKVTVKGGKIVLRGVRAALSAWLRRKVNDLPSDLARSTVERGTQGNFEPGARNIMDSLATDLAYGLLPGGSIPGAVGNVADKCGNPNGKP